MTTYVFIKDTDGLNKNTSQIYEEVSRINSFGKLDDIFWIESIEETQFWTVDMILPNEYELLLDIKLKSQ